MKVSKDKYYSMSGVLWQWFGDKLGWYAKWDHPTNEYEFGVASAGHTMMEFWVKEGYATEVTLLEDI